MHLPKMETVWMWFERKNHKVYSILIALPILAAASFWNILERSNDYTERGFQVNSQSIYDAGVIILSDNVRTNNESVSNAAKLLAENRISRIHLMSSNVEDDFVLGRSLKKLKSKGVPGYLIDINRHSTNAEAYLSECLAEDGVGSMIFFGEKTDQERFLIKAWSKQIRSAALAQNLQTNLEIGNKMNIVATYLTHEKWIEQDELPIDPSFAIIK